MERAAVGGRLLRGHRAGVRAQAAGGPREGVGHDDQRPRQHVPVPGTPSPAWWNAPTNPWSIGAGTSEQGYGWGVPGFGQDPIKILTEYLPYLQSQTTGQQGGLHPRQRHLQPVPPGPALAAGADHRADLQQPVGLRGARRPHHGRGERAGGGHPVPLAQRGQQLFQLTGPNLERPVLHPGQRHRPRGEPLRPVHGGRSPQVVGPLLVQAISEGRLQPTTAGQQFMQEYFGVTPQQYGGASAGGPARPAGGLRGRRGAGRAGRASPRGPAPASSPCSRRRPAAQIAFTEWSHEHLGTKSSAMETGERGLPAEVR